MGLGLGNIAGGFVQGYRTGSELQDRKADRDAKRQKTKMEGEAEDRAAAGREVYKSLPVAGVDEVAGNYDPAEAGRQAGLAALAARQEQARKENRSGLVGIIDKISGRNRDATAASSGIGAPPPPVMVAPDGAAPAAAAPGIGVAPPAARPAAAVAPPGVAPAAAPAGLGVPPGGAPPAAAPAAPAPGEVEELTVTAPGKHKITKAEAAMQRMYSLRQIGDVPGSMEAFKEYEGEKTKEIQMAIVGGTDSQIETRLAEMYNKPVDIETKDGKTTISVDGQVAHTFDTRDAMKEFAIQSVANNPEALLAASKMGREGLQTMVTQAQLKSATQQLRLQAEQGARLTRQDFRTETAFQQAQADRKEMLADADALEDPDAGYLNYDTASAAAKRMARRPEFAKTEATFVDEGETSRPTTRTLEMLNQRKKAIEASPWMQGPIANRVVGTYTYTLQDGTTKRGFAVKDPTTGKPVAVRDFDDAVNKAKGWYPSGPPGASKKKK